MSLGASNLAKAVVILTKITENIIFICFIFNLH